MFLGKSTLLQAIAVGHYDKIPGDGRELCISLSEAVTVRAEDGRYVNNWYVLYKVMHGMLYFDRRLLPKINVAQTNSSPDNFVSSWLNLRHMQSNISAFISNLPTPPGVTTPLDTQHFSTRDSSGSTSQAANVSEAIEFGAKALLVDEDIRYVS